MLDFALLKQHSGLLKNLKNNGERTIVLGLLASWPNPLRQWEVFEMLGIDRRYCREHCGRLSEAGVIEITKIRGEVSYRITEFIVRDLDGVKGPIDGVKGPIDGVKGPIDGVKGPVDGTEESENSRLNSLNNLKDLKERKKEEENFINEVGNPEPLAMDSQDQNTETPQEAPTALQRADEPHSPLKPHLDHQDATDVPLGDDAATPAPTLVAVDEPVKNRTARQRKPVGVTMSSYFPNGVPKSIKSNVAPIDGKKEFKSGTIFVTNSIIDETGAKTMEPPLYAMLKYFDAEPLVDPKSWAARISLLAGKSTHEIFYYFIDEFFNIFVPGTENKATRTITRPYSEIFDDVIHRIAFGYMTTDLGTVFSTPQELFASAKKKKGTRKTPIRNIILQEVRSAFLNSDFGWNSDMINNVEYWRTEREIEGREYLFPSYHNQQEYVRTEEEVKKKNDEAMRKQAEKEAKEAQERKAQQAVSDVITERGEAFKSLGANCQISNKMANFLKEVFAEDEAGLEAYLAESLRVSQEMRQLSAVKFSERSTELIRKGWQQFSDHPNVWYPPLAREPLSPDEEILRELKLLSPTHCSSDCRVIVEETRIVIEVKYKCGADYLLQMRRPEINKIIASVLGASRPFSVVASGAAVSKIGDVLSQLQPALTGC